MAKALEFLAAWKGRLAAAFFMVAVGAVLGGALAWWLQGNRYERQLSERGRELAELRATHAWELAAAADLTREWSERYREAERNAGLARDNIMAQARKEADDEKMAAAAALAEYRAGTRRLSLAIRAYQAGSGAAAADAGAAGRPGEARAELDPAAGAALYAIAVDGNRGIRDANTCIDLYNAVRDQLNAVADPPGGGG